MCIYRKAFAFKPICNQLNILVDCNLSFTKSLNTSYFKVNGQILCRLNTIKNFATSFPFLSLHAVNLLLWKKILSHFFQIYYSNQTKHTPQGVFYTWSGFATRGETGEGSPHPCPKSSVSSHFCMSFPTKKLSPLPFLSFSFTPSLPSLQTKYWKKVSLIVITFRAILI